MISRFLKCVSLAILFLSLNFTGTGSAATGGDDAYGSLLETYVRGGRVDYRGFKQAEAGLDGYLEHLAQTDPLTLSRAGQMALYINAYNACTVKLILDHFEDGRPVRSIKEIGGFFGKPWGIRFCRVGGGILTLDEIEHDILRPAFKDPRVHFAINCASRSCPPLISEPYREATLERQLDVSTTAFINDPGSNYLEDSKLHVSRIFKWFAEDFPEGVIPFVLRYARGDLRERLNAAGDRISVRYLDYDWSLNGL